MEEFKEQNRQFILIDSSLYTEFQNNSLTKLELGKIFLKGSVDAYCPECNKKSIFKVKGPDYSLKEEAEKLIPGFGVFTVEARCMSDSTSEYSSQCGYSIYSSFRIGSDKIIKIGQHPSKGDMDFGCLDEMYKELDKKQRSELGTAIGLFSHGVGIGSFVYLRRIFENLIEDARAEASQEASWDESKYINCRMNEKIKMLANYLPSRLVKTAKLYGILSKGIHELTEEECKKYFPIVRQAIQYILSEKHEQKEYEKLAVEIDGLS